jgi:hypothetical protein
MMTIMNSVFRAAFILMIVASPVSANQDGIRPGLWEVATTSDLLNLVPHIPPDTMQQITDLARQYGLVMPRIQNKTAISHVCITPAMAAQDIPTYFYDGQSGCSVKNARRSGNRFQIELFCDSTQFQGNGTAEGVFTSPEDFSGHTEFDSVVMGSPVYATAETRGRWMGEQCGVTQPATRPSTLPQTIPAQ